MLFRAPFIHSVQKLFVCFDHIFDPFIDQFQVAIRYQHRNFNDLVFTRIQSGHFAIYPHQRSGIEVKRSLKRRHLEFRTRRLLERVNSGGATERCEDAKHVMGACVRSATTTTCMQEANVLEFGKALLNDPSSVEILPGDLDSWTLLPNTPFLLIDGNLGIPQKPLYGLYILAISMLTSSRRGTQKDAEDLNRLTAVLLLANPAHQTAANHRKRMIIQGLLSARKELAFLGRLQANKSHAKESILWSHRQWLLRHLGLTTSGESDTLDVFRNEFAIIYRAAEIYPRNYYAWNHWRFCIDALVTHLSEPQSDPFAQVLLEQYHQLTRWLEQHVSDYSAAHHLAGLVSLIQTFSTPAHDLPSQINPQAAFELSMSLSTFFSSHVTLRMFVETLIKIELDEGRKNQMRIRFGELVQQLDP